MNLRNVLAMILVVLAFGVGLFSWLGNDINLIWSQYLLEVQSLQRGLHQDLSAALSAIDAQGFEASLTLIGLSFFYGIFHAAGPGHGKIVISTYLLSHESQLRRGILLSFASSLAQGLTAILVVTLAVWLLGYSMKQTQGLVFSVEMASFALIALVGFFIALSRALSLVRLLRHRPEHPHNGHPHNGHHQHGEASCGHAHGPTQTDLQNPLSIKGFAGIILSIGIRPCSGAVIVLLLAYSLGLYAAGLFSVMAMSIGTALTVSVLAMLSVYARKIVSRFVSSGAGESLSLSGLGDVVGIVGGALIFMFGTVLLSAALFAPVHPFR